MRRGEGAHRVVLVRLEPVEEVLRVEHDLFAVRGEEPHAVSDHGEVLLGFRFQNVGDVADMALPEDGAVLRVRRKEGFEVCVLLGRDAFAAG